jgi:hypothetical protein
LSAAASSAGQTLQLGEASAVVSLDRVAASSAVFLGFWRSNAPALLH